MAALVLIAQPRAAWGQQAVCEEILVPMSDGIHLHGWLRHGANLAPEQKRPVIWTMSPYSLGGTCRTQLFGNVLPADVLEQVSLVTISYRGTGISEGEQDAWGPGDRIDVQEAGWWLAWQPFTEGLFPAGASAEGAWITFALDHPEVIGALWMTSCANGYRQCVRSGGQLAGGGFVLTALEAFGYMAGLTQRFYPQNSTYANPTSVEQLLAISANFSPAFTEDEEGDFWKTRLGFRYLEGVSVPVMFTTDLYDYVPGGMYLAYERFDPEYRYLNTAVGHNMAADGKDVDTTLGQLSQEPVHRFLRKYLLRELGIEDPQRVRLVTNLGTPSGFKRAEVLVRDEDDWPLPSTVWTRLYLGEGSAIPTQSLNDGSLRLDAPAAGSEVVPLLTLTGPKGELRTMMSVFGRASSPELIDTSVRAFHDDLRPEEAAGLTYTTPPLAGDTEIVGPSVLQVRATSGAAENFDWQVRLADVHPDGRSAWITDGQLRASLREIDDEQSVKNAQGDYTRPWLTFDEHEPVPIGEAVDYVVELAPTSNVFRKGHRIRLDIQPIASGYVDSGTTGGAGTLEVHRGGIEPSRLILPVIPGRCQTGAPGLAGIEVPSCGDALLFDDEAAEGGIGLLP